MIELRYSITIEATEDPNFFTFYSPELEGFTGVGSSVEDCLYKAKWGMVEHAEMLSESSLAVPAANPHPRVIIENSKREAEIVKILPTSKNPSTSQRPVKPPVAREKPKRRARI